MIKKLNKTLARKIIFFYNCNIVYIQCNVQKENKREKWNREIEKKYVRKFVF